MTGSFHLPCKYHIIASAASMSLSTISPCLRLQVGGLGDVVKAAASRVGLHDPAGPLEKRFTPHCCRHWWNTYLFLAGLDERYRGYLRGDVPDGSQGQYIHMDALRREIKKRYLECIPRLGI